MKWVIDENTRCDLVFYTGIGCAGRETAVRVFPASRKGDMDEPFQSMKMFGPVGARIYLCTSVDDDHWQDKPWRCIRIQEKTGKKVSARMRMVYVHDLDLYNDATALRLPTDGAASFPEVAKPEEGTGWTFGHGPGGLKNRVHMIRVTKDA